MSSDRCVVVVLAKAPVAGSVKTRLAPALGAEGAASLAEWMLDRTMTAALDAGIGTVELCGDPDGTHPAFERWSERSGVTFETQGDGDLGERMASVFERRSGGASRVLVIGTDAPSLDADVLRRASESLRTHDAVFVPTFDGGYALVGLRGPAPRLFDDMAWSTSEVMSVTRDRLRSCGLRHEELATLHDIDVPDDLVHLDGLGWHDG